MKVYSYLRFSAAKQATGASVARQTDYANKWAADHGMTLDETLSMRDEGLSAYHQKHVKSGALGVFLAAIENGKIPAGSVLIVEGLDRLSRAEPILAQAQLAQIINADITVVTASDGKQYNRERLKANPMDLVYSLLVMVRAHEESETKSKRVSDVLRRRCEGWVAGTYRGKIACGSDPSWVRWNGKQFELVPDLAENIRMAVKMFTDGFGARRILNTITGLGLKITGDQQAGNITQLLRGQSHLFAGERIVAVGSSEYVLQGYYPPLLNNEEYSRLVVALAARKRVPRANGGKSEYPALVTGMNMTTCGRCGGLVFSRNQKRVPKANGAEIYRRLVCLRCESAKEGGGCNSDAVERAILEYCSDQLNLEALVAGGGDQTATLRAERAAVAIKIGDLEKKIERMTDAMLEDADGIPQAMVRRLRDMETELARLKAREHQIAIELSAAAVTASPASAKVWADLKDGALALDFAARIKCRQLIADTFFKVQVFFRGAMPNTPPGVVDVMLISKSGNARLLRIDRKTGELVHGLNLNKGAEA